MLRSLRRRLRHIRYYSASRRQTAWTRAMDAAIIASLVLALPVAWMSVLAIRLPGGTQQADGVIGRLEDGRLAAVIGDAQRGDVTPPGVPIGDFSMSLGAARRGWPVTARIDTLAIEIIMDIYDEPAVRRNPALEAEDPLRRAMEAALVEEGELELLSAWHAGRPRSQSRVLGWIVLTAVWWVMLWGFSSIVIQVLAYWWRVRHGRAAVAHASRIATGRCGRCGYDTRGLEFCERCPECGEILL